MDSTARSENINETVAKDPRIVLLPVSHHQSSLNDGDIAWSTPPIAPKMTKFGLNQSGGNNFDPHFSNQSLSGVQTDLSQGRKNVPTAAVCQQEDGSGVENVCTAVLNPTENLWYNRQILRLV